MALEENSSGSRLLHIPVAATRNRDQDVLCSWCPWRLGLDWITCYRQTVAVAVLRIPSENSKGPKTAGTGSFFRLSCAGCAATASPVLRAHGVTFQIRKSAIALVHLG